MENARDLGTMLRSFRLEPLREDELAEFFYEHTMATRTGDEWKSPLRNLFKACTMPSDANAHLLLGHRGCGKSTELANLKRQLEEAGQPVRIVDCALELDLFQATCWDIMLLITEGLCEIAKEKNIAIHTDTIQAVLDYLKKDKEIIETEDTSLALEASAGAKVSTPFLLEKLLSIFGSIKTDAKLSAGTHIVVKEKLEPRTSDWLNYTKLMATFISEGCGDKQPIVIFEGLDKLPMPENIFNILRFTALAEMPFPVIYTFPISQYYSSTFSTIRDLYTPHILPMIKISNLDKSENAEGIAVMREIVKKRADLALFDGEGENSVLEYLIRKTGGSLRHLFDCIMNAARRADWRGAGRIQHEDADSALSGLRSELTRLIVYPDFQNLANIYKDKKYRERIDDRDLLLRMTQASVVIEYQNGKRWHDLHPLIADFLADQGEVDG